jgi:hypothetical protein
VREQGSTQQSEVLHHSRLALALHRIRDTDPLFTKKIPPPRRGDFRIEHEPNSRRHQSMICITLRLDGSTSTTWLSQFT